MPAAIRAYRTQYEIPGDDPRPLGPPPSAGAFQQRLDRRDAVRSALEALDSDNLTPRAQALRDQLRELERPSMERDTAALEHEL